MNAIQKIRLIVRLSIVARLAKRSPASTGIVGLTGVAQTAIGPHGTIFVRGELWPAYSHVSIVAGARVRVSGIEGVMLEVETP